MSDRVATVVAKDRRHRGTHSTACKCPSPLYIRPSHYKPLSREHGRALHNIMARDRHSGEWTIRRRVSADPLFTFLRFTAGRRRAFREIRRNLIDALFALLINKVDLATGIVTINVTKLAEELSPCNDDGHVISEEAVTVSRVSRTIDELTRFGVLLSPEDNSATWDRVNGCRFPKHVIITDAGWKLTGVNMNKLRAEQDERLRAIDGGLLQPGEVITVKAARKRWYDNCRLQTILSRRTRATESKQRRILAELPFDERKRRIADRIFKDMKGEIYRLTPQQFEKMVWKQIYRLRLEPPEISSIHIDVGRCAVSTSSGKISA